MLFFIPTFGHFINHILKRRSVGEEKKILDKETNKWIRYRTFTLNKDQFDGKSIEKSSKDDIDGSEKDHGSLWN